MAEVDQNLENWSSEWDWSHQGDEWSAAWGDTPALWHGALLPRIHSFVPAGTVLEIAPGYGRWTQYLKDLAERLVIVDLTQGCIDHCRRRFADAANIEYHVNDGRSLEMVDDGSVDLAFSFDSLVHAESDVIGAYLEQLARKLAPDGVGFIHHSNMGAYRPLARLARRVPGRAVGPLVKRGLLVNVIAWRAESVTAETVAEQCDRAGLACIGQEKISWEAGRYLIDTLSMFTRKGSRWDRPRAVVANPLFTSEARRMARLYAQSSFPGGASNGSG
ncbi:MAG TPA: class I SAM-dependent methyltransferase [Thermoleophilaceae bacterium]|jgi:SAM-dependent methyltransferase